MGTELCPLSNMSSVKAALHCNLALFSKGRFFSPASPLELELHSCASASAAAAATASAAAAAAAGELPPDHSDFLGCEQRSE